MSQSTLHNPSHLCQHLHCFKPFPRWSSSRCSSTACDNIRGTLGNSRQWFMREMMLMLQDFNYTLSYMVSCASSHTLLQHQGIPRSVFEGQCNVCNVLCKQGTPKHLISELKSASAASQPYAVSTVQMACSSLLSHPCNEFSRLQAPLKRMPRNTRHHQHWQWQHWGLSWSRHATLKATLKNSRWWSMSSTSLAFNFYTFISLYTSNWPPPVAFKLVELFPLPAELGHWAVSGISPSGVLAASWCSSKNRLNRWLDDVRTKSSKLEQASNP